MKRILSLLLALLLLAGCASPATESPGSAGASAPAPEDGGDAAPVPEEDGAAYAETLTEPPALTVDAGSASVTAWRGTYTWSYTNDDGTATGVTADSVHPLDDADQLPLLPANAAEAALTFSFHPTSVFVCSWTAGTTAEEAALSDTAMPELANGEALSLQPGQIYEIHAVWESDWCWGDAYYAFRTEDAPTDGVADGADEAAAWGVTLAAEDVTATGLTLRCTQSGGSADGELHTGTEFALEQSVDGQWQPVPLLNGDICWDSVAWIIPADETVAWETDWTHVYGELAPGTYRISKEIFLYRAPGDYDTRTVWAVFAIVD